VPLLTLLVLYNAKCLFTSTSKVLRDQGYDDRPLIYLLTPWIGRFSKPNPYVDEPEQRFFLWNTRASTIILEPLRKRSYHVQHAELCIPEERMRRLCLRVLENNQNGRQSGQTHLMSPIVFLFEYYGECIDEPNKIVLASALRANPRGSKNPTWGRGHQEGSLWSRFPSAPMISISLE
jgi:hypothetical protein